MKEIYTKIISKFHICSCKRPPHRMSVLNNDSENAHDFQARGSEILKVITNTMESSTAKSPAIRRIDVKSEKTGERDDNEKGQEVSIVQHHKKHTEQHDCHQKHQIEEFKGKNNNINERQNKMKKLKYLKRTIELARRKRFENKGSFAMNMVIFQDHEVKTSQHVIVKGCNKMSNTIVCTAFNDERSRSSESTCVSNDLTLQVIDEERIYYNTH